MSKLLRYDVGSYDLFILSEFHVLTSWAVMQIYLHDHLLLMHLEYASQ
jgi:hypothetical protein